MLTVRMVFYLHFGEFAALSGPSLWATIAAVVIALPIFEVTGLYRAIFR
jgi:hypothetical protein